jgi:hypothetical protein
MFTATDGSLAMPEFAETSRMIHFDFHMPDFVERVGHAADFDAIVAAMKRARVNGIAVFTKCHYGNATYPTVLGNAHPNLAKDLVGGMTAACRRAGLLVRLYYSAAIDERVKRQRPEWMRRSADGQIGSMVCFNSPYVSQLAAPQVREIAGRYDFDEFFFDFAANANLAPCYCDHCRAAYRQECDAELPTDPNDGAWGRYASWFRQVGYAFEQQMADAVHTHRPSARVGFNWAYSTRMPEPPRDYVGYLTMDPAPNMLAYSLEGRYLAALGLPYEIMTQRFIEHWGDWTMKPAAVLRQEFATVLANGGSCILGDKFYPDGAIDSAVYSCVRKLYRFVAKREPLVRGATPAKDVAVLHSASTFYSTGTQLFSNEMALAKVRGAHKMLVQCNEHFNIVNERTLREAIGDYACVVLPEQEVLAPETVAALYKYVQEGGTLVASYPFPRELDRLLGVRFKGPAPSKWGYLAGLTKRLRRGVRNMPLVVHGRFGQFELLSAKPLAEYIEPYPVNGFFVYNWQEPPPFKPTGCPAVTLNRAGRGRAAMIAGEIFASYARHDYPELRKLVANLIRRSVRRRRLKVSAPPCVEVTHWRRDRADLIHLVNSRYEIQHGPQWAIAEKSLPVHDIGVSLLRARKPKSVLLLPQERRIKFTFRRGRVRLAVPRLKTHTCVVIE